jgi:hypothetical protein
MDQSDTSTQVACDRDKVKISTSHKPQNFFFFEFSDDLGQLEAARAKNRPKGIKCTKIFMF